MTALLSSLRRVTLKPYGNSLCTPGAGFWIFATRVVIACMAIAEGLSWAYLGQFFGSGSWGAVYGCITGTLVFCIIWIIDASFATLDTSRGFYERTLATVRQQGPFTDRLKSGLGIVARLVIVTASLYISAPFLAQLVFQQDIESEIRKRNLERVAAARMEIANLHDTRFRTLARQLADEQEQLVLEVAGRGPS